MLKRLKRTDDSSQLSQIHDDPIDKGRNRCELLDAEKQQTESDPFNPFTTEPLAISLLLETDNLGIIH